MNNIRILRKAINDLQFRLWATTTDCQAEYDLEKAREICLLLIEHLDMLTAVQALAKSGKK